MASMHTIEAVLSLLAFASILTIVQAGAAGGRGIDDSLYRMQLGEDAWRVLYLRGDFEGFGASGQNRTRIEADMQEIGRISGFCLHIGGVRYTNCRDGGGGSEPVITLRKTLICGRAPMDVEFSLRR
jgi:hypothetical protein